MNPTILLTDASSTSRTLVRQLLEGEDYEVVEAADGLAAAVEFERVNPGLVVTDIDLPPNDAAALLIRLCRNKGTPVVALSTHTDSETVKVCLAHGCSTLLAKPIDAVDLVLAVKLAIDRSTTLKDSGFARTRA